MSGSDRRKVRLGMGILLSLVFLYLAVRGIDWAELVRLFRDAEYSYLVLALAIIAFLSWVRGLRWHYLVRRDPGIDVPTLFHLMNIGYFFNNTLPAKAGEFVRGYLAGRKLTGGYGQAASSVLIGALLDALSMIVILLILLPIVAVPEWIRRVGVLFGALALFGLAVLLVAARRGARGVEWLWSYLGRLPLVGRPAVRAAFEELVSGFSVLIELRYLVPVLLTTCVVWIVSAGLNYVMMLVFHMEGLPFTAAVMVLCATGFSMMVPSSPGAVGVFEWAGMQGLLIFGVDQSAAFGYMLGLHLLTNLTLILLGVIGMITQGISYSHVREAVASREQRKDVPAGAPNAP